MRTCHRRSAGSWKRGTCSRSRHRAAGGTDGPGRTSVRTRPPVPKPPLTGNLFDYTRDHLGFLVRCARECYDVVRLRFINIQTHLLNHQDHIEYVLVRNDRNFWSSRSPRGSTREPRAFGRETVGDCEIGGYHAPAETPLIIISQWLTHRDPRYYERA